MLGGAWARTGGVTKWLWLSPSFHCQGGLAAPPNTWLGMNDVSAERAVAEWVQKLRAMPLVLGQSEN